VILFDEAVQPLASFTVTVYVPAITVKVFANWNAPPFKLYAYGNVPPVALAVKIVLPPTVEIVPAVADVARVGGKILIVTFVPAEVHPLLFLTLAV
jgi:hypothetical protein